MDQLVVLVMPSRGDLTDDEWALLEPLLPKSNNRCGRWRDHRQVINGIIHRLGAGCQWRDGVVHEIRLWLNFWMLLVIFTR